MSGASQAGETLYSKIIIFSIILRHNCRNVAKLVSSDALNSEISELAREVKQAKANAEASAPRISSYAFDSAKSAFESAKARHESAQAEFKRLKAQRDSAKAEFDRLQAQFKQAQAAFNRRLEEVKSERTSRKQQSVDKVNMALVKSNAHYLGTLFGQNAKVVPHGDGTTHVFFGGLNAAGDGMGHGHAVIDRESTSCWPFLFMA